MKVPKSSNEAVPKARRAGSREALVEAAERLFLERGFGSVSMDDLDGVSLARWTYSRACLSSTTSKSDAALSTSKYLD